MPIVILTEDEAFMKKFSTERIEVFVLSMKQTVVLLKQT